MKISNSIISLLLIVVMCFSMVACGSEKTTTTTAGGTTSTTAPTGTTGGNQDSGNNGDNIFEDITDYEPVTNDVQMESQSDSFTLSDVTYGAEEKFVYTATVSSAP